MKKFALGLMVLCLFSTTHVFAFWSVLFPSNFAKVNCSLEIGKFNNAFCPWKDIFVVDDDFKQEFMFFNGTTWKFQSEIWKDEQKINYLRQITKTYKFIKTDLIYAVISEEYTLLDNGIPFENLPSYSWAVAPIKLEYVEGWAYNGRVVRGSDKCFYYARFYTTHNPVVSRRGWDKIEPVSDADFLRFENTCIVNYGAILPQSLKRSYIWEDKTEYLPGDVVCHNEILFEALQKTIGNNPLNDSSWKRLWKN